MEAVNKNLMLLCLAGLGQYISGCIMFDETLYQDSRAGVPFVKLLNAQGIVAGIKVRPSSFTTICEVSQILFVC